MGRSVSHSIRPALALIALAAILAGCAWRAPGTPDPTEAALAAAPTLAATAPPATRTPLPPTATRLPEPTTTPLPATATPSATDVPLTATPTLAALDEQGRLQIFDEVWETVRDEYVYTDYRGLDWDAVREELRPRVAQASTEETYRIIAEMIERLGDDHSRFDTPQQVIEDQARAQGNRSYVGIGVVLRDAPEGGVVVRVAHGGPAEEAGILARDVIAAVNGIPFTATERFGPEGPRGLIRSSSDQDAVLTIRSPDQRERVVRVRSRVIPSDALPTVEGSILPGTRIGLLLIDDFQLDDLDDQIRASLQEIARDGPLEGLVIDVRSNLGGYVYQMENAISFFVDGGTIGSTRGRRQRFDIQIPTGQRLDAFRDTPIVVLISGETASAGEMFASGMQTLNRAVIVGTPSSGNTENLLGKDLSDGSRLWLAELVFERPDGSSIEGSGVAPDRVVDAQWWQYEASGDPQIQAAVEEIARSAQAQQP
jgi:C-terminal peptidase prc